MTNLRRLEYFLAVARERNFTRAAERLHIAQPALSRQVRELERELGTELIHRTTHAFELTEAGTLLLARGPQLIASADELWRSVRAHGSGEVGDVVVAYGASASYETAPRLLEALARDQPGIAIGTEVRAAAEIVAGVQDGSVDLGLVRCPPDVPGLEPRTVRADRHGDAVATVGDSSCTGLPAELAWRPLSPARSLGIDLVARRHDRSPAVVRATSPRCRQVTRRRSGRCSRRTRPGRWRRATCRSPGSGQAAIASWTTSSPRRWRTTSRGRCRWRSPGLAGSSPCASTWTRATRARWRSDEPAADEQYGPPMLPDALTTPAAEIAEKLGAAGHTLAVAESSAGGLISASLLSVSGASRYYRGGFVTYTHDGTRAVLADATDLEPGDRGACEPFARFLASAARGKLSADWSVSETGASGPTGNRYGDPAGHAWVAVAGPDGLLRTEHILTGSDDRPGNMVLFAAAALGLLLTTLT